MDVRTSFPVSEFSITPFLREQDYTSTDSSSPIAEFSLFLPPNLYGERTWKAFWLNLEESSCDCLAALRECVATRTSKREINTVCLNFDRLYCDVLVEEKITLLMPLRKKSSLVTPSERSYSHIRISRRRIWRILERKGSFQLSANFRYVASGSRTPEPLLLYTKQVNDIQYPDSDFAFNARGDLMETHLEWIYHTGKE
jgi:hypothetical protein